MSENDTPPVSSPRSHLTDPPGELTSSARDSDNSAVSSNLLPLPSISHDTLPDSQKDAVPVRRAQSIVNKLAVLRSPFRNSYQKLDDVPSDSLRAPALPEEPDEAVAIDISTIDGGQGIPLKAFDYAHQPVSGAPILSEDGPYFSGGLGQGLDHVHLVEPSVPVAASLDSSDNKAVRLKPSRTIARRNNRRSRPPRLIFDDAANKEAAERNEIIAIDESEAFNVDLSNVEGGKPSNATSNTTMLADGNVSYYFPPDPEMHNYRPFAMRPWYIGILVAVGLVIAAVQEYLCQRSMRLAETPQGGLLKFTDANDVSTLDFFAWKYFPTMVTVTYGILWQITDFDVKRLEPFYQLSRPSGSTAESSLNLDYISQFSYLVPFKALRHRHWSVLLSSLGTLLASAAVPIFQSASIMVTPSRSQQKPFEPKYVRIDPAWSRVMEASLLLTVSMGLLLLFQLRRKSGLMSNPQGVAGLAAMATRSHILQDFRYMDISDHNDIHNRLSKRRYILHKSALWQAAYLHQSNTRPHTERKVKNPHPTILRLASGISYIGFILVFFILLPILMFTRANIVTEKAPWLLTLLATAIKMIWTTLENNVRLIEPFFRLAERHAPPSILTLDYRGLVPVWLPIRAILNKHYLVAAVGIGTILTEVLVVCVSSFNVDGKTFVSISHPLRNTSPSAPDGEAGSGETFHSFWASFGLVLIILLVLSFMASAVYIRRRHAFLPRQPNTIASVLAFIAQSKMLFDFVSDEKDIEDGANSVRIEEMDSETMTRHLENLNKTYGLGWIRGRDGELYVGIDEEELVANYEHGQDRRAGRLAAHDISAWQHY